MSPCDQIYSPPYALNKISDIDIDVTGKLVFHSACKAYGARVLIQAQTIMTSNNTEKDIISHYLLNTSVVCPKEKLLI
jgi:hypothetical protein